MADDVVFLFDVDNTLVDNDRVTVDLRRHLEREVGAERGQRYWAIFEELRTALGYADYLGALQRYRIEYPRDPHLLMVSRYLINYPFANRLFPESLDVVERCRAQGRAVILTDGDVVFQPRKIERSGIWAAVEGHDRISGAVRHQHRHRPRRRAAHVHTQGPRHWGDGGEYIGAFAGEPVGHERTR